jgi:hypothetical protein
VIKFVSDLQQVGGYQGTPVSSTNKTDRHDITVENVIKHHKPTNHSIFYE